MKKYDTYQILMSAILRFSPLIACTGKKTGSDFAQEILRNSDDNNLEAKMYALIVKEHIEDIDVGVNSMTCNYNLD